jgi:alanine racemase
VAEEALVAELEGLRPAWVTVDLARLESNLRWLRRRCGDAQVLAVVKADAYGHGAVAVARALAPAVDWLGVALVEEGVELRRAGVAAPVLVLGTVQPGQLELVEEHRLTPALSSAAQLAMWRERGAARGGAPLAVHLKVDTGMTRLGIPAEELDQALAALRAAPGLVLAGVLSHLAEAEELGSPRTGEQERAFAAALTRLSPAERERVVVHLANSAGAIHHPSARHGMVRLGLALYGLDPAGSVDAGAALRPVMSVESRLVQVREVAAGSRLGYGGRWRAERASRIGAVPVGYADGYPWRLGTRAVVLVAGRRAPVVGSVSMDTTLVDLTDLPPAAAADEPRVVLLGEDGGERIGADELARHAGTIAYEVLCLLGSLRLPRRTVRGGETVEVRTRFAAAAGAASPGAAGARA